MSTSAVSVTTSATALVAENFSRVGLIIENMGTVIVYMGDASTVTTSTGITLQPGEKYIDAATSDKGAFYFKGGLWGIVTTGTADCRVLEMVTTR